MKVKQNLTFLGNLAGGRVKLPKYALYAYDRERQLYYYVHDVRTCAYETFDVYTYDVMRNMSGRILGRANKGIGVLFAKFADALPLECIHAPEYPRYSGVAAYAPHDRLPQKFDQRGRREHFADSPRSVIDGAIIGGHKYRQEGYYALRLAIK